MPTIEFVVVPRRREIVNSLYAQADALGIAAGGLGALHVALRDLADVGSYKSKNRLRSRTAERAPQN